MKDGKRDGAKNVKKTADINCITTIRGNAGLSSLRMLEKRKMRNKENIVCMCIECEIHSNVEWEIATVVSVTNGQAIAISSTTHSVPIFAIAS